MGISTNTIEQVVRDMLRDTPAGKSLAEADQNRKTAVAEIQRAGTKLIIPAEMTLDDAARVIQAKQQDEENVVALSDTFDVFVWEGAYALAKTLDTKYGWFQQIKIPGGWFEPDQAPAMVSVKIGPDETVQVPWGRFTLPNMTKKDGWLETGFFAKPGEIPKFRLTAELKKKHSVQFKELCDGVREQLKTFSLYKGKAVTVKFFGEDGDRLKFPEPDFSKIHKLKAEDLIFSRHIEAAVDANLLTPITRTEMCRKYGIPLKRGVALAGPFGTGKTLIAQRTATLAAEHGWTYIVCPSTADFPDCVRFAQRYQPAVVFCEDIDKATKGDRDEEMDDVLNTIDGVNSKQTEIILVLTTNEIEEINQAMLRPGRLDAIIHVDRPDAEAVGRLLRHYAGDLLPRDEDLKSIGKQMAGSTPAVIREIVERSKLAAISLMKDGDTLRLSENAFIIANNTMKMHRELMDTSKKDPLNDMEILGNVLGNFMVRAAMLTKRDHPEQVAGLASLPEVSDLQVVRVVESDGTPLHKVATLDAVNV